MRVIFAFLLCAVLAAQSPTGLPPGHAVFSHLAAPSAGATGGLSTFDPTLGLGSVARLSPLPVALSGSTQPLTVSGANCVLVRDHDGMVFAGPLVRGTGTPVAIYALALQGTTVTATTSYPIGSSAASLAGIDQMDFLPDGRIVFAARGLSGWGQDVGILDPGTGVVARVPSGVAGIHNALALSRDGASIYVGTGSQLWSVPLGGTGPTTLVASFPNGIYQLAVDHLGQVHAGLYSNVYRCDPAAGTVALVALTTEPNALAIDRVTGHLLVLALQPNSTVVGLHIDPVNTATSPMGGTLPLHLCSGVAVRNRLYTFGSAAPAANTQTWRWEGNPGGPPVIGNASFSLTLDSNPGNAWSFLAVSLGTTPPTNIGPVGNVMLNPSPGQAVLFQLLPPGPSATLPLGIPAGLLPMDLYAQAFQDNGGTFVGGSGLAIHVR